MRTFSCHTMLSILFDSLFHVSFSIKTKKHICCQIFLHVFMHAEAAEVQVHSTLHPGSAQVTMAWRPMGRWDLWDESP